MNIIIVQSVVDNLTGANGNMLDRLDEIQLKMLKMGYHV
jgi:hypothetical protein